jgi:hypothetical protein
MAIIPYKGQYGQLAENTGSIYVLISLVISIGGADGWCEEHHNYDDFFLNYLSGNGLG